LRLRPLPVFVCDGVRRRCTSPSTRYRTPGAKIPSLPRRRSFPTRSATRCRPANAAPAAAAVARRRHGGSKTDADSSAGKRRQVRQMLRMVILNCAPSGDRYEITPFSGSPSFKTPSECSVESRVSWLEVNPSPSDAKLLFVTVTAHSVYALVAIYRSCFERNPLPLLTAQPEKSPDVRGDAAVTASVASSTLSEWGESEREKMEHRMA